MPITFAQPEPYDAQVAEDYGAMQQYQQALRAGGGGHGGGGGGGGGAQPWGEGSMTQGDTRREYGDLTDYGGRANAHLALNEGMLTQAENMRLQRMQMGLSSIQEQLESGEIDEEMAGDLAFEVKNNMAPLQKRMMESQTAQRNAAAEQHTQQAAQIQARMARDAEFQATELNKRVQQIRLPDGTQVTVVANADGTLHELRGGGAGGGTESRQQQQAARREEFTMRVTGQIEDALARELDSARRTDPNAMPPWADPSLVLTPEERVNRGMEAEIRRRLNRRLEISGMGPSTQQAGPSGGGQPPADPARTIEQGSTQLNQQLERLSSDNADISAATFDLRQALADPNTSPMVLRDMINGLPPEVAANLQVPRSYANAILAAANQQQNSARDDSRITTPNASLPPGHPDRVAAVRAGSAGRAAATPRGATENALGSMGVPVQQIRQSQQENRDVAREMARPTEFTGAPLQQVLDAVTNEYNLAGIAQRAPVVGAVHAAGQISDLIRPVVENGQPMTAGQMQTFMRLMGQVQSSRPQLAARIRRIMTDAGIGDLGERRRNE